MTVGRALFLLMLLTAPALAAAPPAAAQGAVPEARNEVRLAVIEYHPFPDADGDPFGFWAVNDSFNVPRDWMRGYYGAASFPTARFDGVGLVANSPDSRPQQFEDDYRREFDARAQQDSPFILNVSGSLNATHALMAVKVVNRGAEPQGMVLRGALFTDDVPFDAPNQVLNHRFVARARFPDTPLQVAVNTAVTHTLAIPLPMDRDGNPLPRSTMGVVFYVQHEGDSGRFQAREVLQSAVYYFRQGQDNPTVQSQKAVLLELYTATWCEACLYGDEAVDRLAKQYGVASVHDRDTGWRYFRGAPAALTLTAALLVGLVAAAYVIPLARGGGRKP